MNNKVSLRIRCSDYMIKRTRMTGHSSRVNVTKSMLESGEEFLFIRLPFLPKSTKVVSVDEGFVINTVSAHVVRRKPVRVEVVLPASWLGSDVLIVPVDSVVEFEAEVVDYLVKDRKVMKHNDSVLNYVFEFSKLWEHEVSAIDPSGVSVEELDEGYLIKGVVGFIYTKPSVLFEEGGWRLSLPYDGVLLDKYLIFEAPFINY